MPPKGKARAKPGAVAALAQKRLREVQEQQQAQREEEERLRREEEERLAAQKRAEEEAAAAEERRRQERREKREQLRKEGKLLTPAQKEKIKRAEAARQALLSSGLQIPALLEQGPTPKTTTTRRSHAIDDRKKKKKQPQKQDVEPTVSGDPIDQPAEDGAETLAAVEEVNETGAGYDEDALDWEEAADKLLEETTNKLKITNEIPEKVGVTVEKPKETKVCPAEQNVKKVVEEPKKESVASNLRSPICCILGHVDTGKTKLLDKIRRTNVQGGEAGGITQQIGATFFPGSALEDQCLKVDPEFDMQVPGLLIIDTPGHESFNNLRVRGSSLCDIAILVVDIMHGLEPQTRESIGLLRNRKCPFIIALNKIDRLYDWKDYSWESSRKSLEKQKQAVNDEFDTRSNGVLLQMAEEGLNCDLWWKVDDARKTVSVVPTSAITGEGIPDLLYLLCKLTQTIITRSLVFRDEFQCTILEVKAIEGLGTTIDVVLVSGVLHENDRVVVCGMGGPIVTTIRALLTPQPLKELRVKGEYVHHKQIQAAMGVKIAANGLEDAVAGTSLFVAGPEVEEDELEDLKEEVMADMSSIFKSVDRNGEGVYVVASTLGSLEALLQYLKDSKVPVFAVNIGAVHKLDVKKASVMREKERPELCCILAFDVKVDADALKEATTLGVKIFSADIIYHLFDDFTKYTAELNEQKKAEKKDAAVFPTILRIIPDCIFNKKDPLIMGVHVEEGSLRLGTPLVVLNGKEQLFLGRVASLEHNRKGVQFAKRGDEVAVRIAGDSSILFGRHFDASQKMYSKMSREAIDCLKEFFMDEMTKEDWKLVVKLKKVLDIP